MARIIAACIHIHTCVFIHTSPKYQGSYLLQAKSNKFPHLLLSASMDAEEENKTHGLRFNTASRLNIIAITIHVQRHYVQKKNRKTAGELFANPKGSTRIKCVNM